MNGPSYIPRRKGEEPSRGAPIDTTNPLNRMMGQTPDQWPAPDEPKTPPYQMPNDDLHWRYKYGPNDVVPWHLRAREWMFGDDEPEATVPTPRTPTANPHPESFPQRPQPESAPVRRGSGGPDLGWMQEFMEPKEGGFYDDIAAKVAGLAVDPEQARQDAITEGLINAGFSMMATDSPYFAQGFGQGGLAGMQAYTDAMDQHGDKEIAQLNMEMALAEAQQAEAMGNRELALRLREHADRMSLGYAQVNKPPAGIAEMEYLLSLPEDKRNEYLEMQRMLSNKGMTFAEARAEVAGGSAGSPGHDYYLARLSELVESGVPQAEATQMALDAAAIWLLQGGIESYSSQ